ncbi:MAG: hypothetical protein ACRDUX_11160, partial [Mycobacterium sp.]
MTRTPRREIDAPVRARRDRLQPTLRRGCDDGQRPLGQRVGGAVVVAAQQRQPVTLEHLDVGDPGGLAARHVPAPWG